MVSYEEALQLVLENCSQMPPRRVKLEDTLGLVLSEDIFSPENIPSFDNSAMDGFAIRAEDVTGASPENPIPLKVINDLKAGSFPQRELRKGEAMRIMTGAPLPPGADAVLRKEYTAFKEGLVLAQKPVKKGDDIRLKGEDIKLGDQVLKKGTQIQEGEVGILASLGIEKVPVYPPPLVAIVTTGDELVGLSEKLTPGKIRDANTFTLLFQVKKTGARARTFPRIPDNKDEIRKALEEAKKCDVIITTGGVSLGEYDFVKEVLEEMGGTLHFWKVKQRPGHPLAFWILEGKPVFGIPGNPAASIICFEEYVRPALRKMMGFGKIFRPQATARMGVDYSKESKGRLQFLRVKLERKETLWAYPSGAQGSAILTSMAAADGIGIIPEDVTFLKKGEEIQVHLIHLPEDH
ncbi:MAG: molybdopterin molybdotransferase MoeA [Caldiserica bacterium]|jgi:molybdopterin molybdotransferase|nr:molybdopterin molybdotransferase MoeA [Caldisericota bacterium]MDH7563106.1 molybdopterin molybdotransferase MoeA [Caldisericota bacterium]